MGMKKSQDDGENQGGYRASSGEKKVVAVAKGVGMPGVLDQLVDLKTRSGNSRSLRELESYFNTRLVQAALSRNGENVDLETARSMYDVITDDDPGRREEKKAKAKLEAYNVDMDRLHNDFVSHHSIQSYLSDVDGVDLSKPEKSLSDREEDLYQRLKKLAGRVQLVTKSTLETATHAGVIPYEDVPPNVNVKVEADCPDCGRTVSVFQLFGSQCSCNDEATEKRRGESQNMTADSDD